MGKKPNSLLSILCSEFTISLQLFEVMLRTRALDAFLGQVCGGGVTGVVLFNKDGFPRIKMIIHALILSGLTVSRAISNENSQGGGNVYSALLANIWETFERQGFTFLICKQLNYCWTFRSPGWAQRSGHWMRAWDGCVGPGGLNAAGRDWRRAHSTGSPHGQAACTRGAIESAAQCHFHVTSLSLLICL